MTWARVDDKLYAHPKADTAGLEAMGLWVLALSYCVDQLTDGHVATERVVRLVGDRKIAVRSAKKLVAAGLWEETADGYRFHDWSSYQPSADSVRAERDRKRRNVADHRARANQSVTGNVTGYADGKLPDGNRPVSGGVSAELPGRNRVPDPDLRSEILSGSSSPPFQPERAREASPAADDAMAFAPEPQGAGFGSSDVGSPGNRDQRPVKVTLGDASNLAVRAVLAILRGSPELRQVATVELATNLAQHCSEHGFTGQHKLETVLASLREAAAKAEVQAAGGEPITRLPAFLLGCVKRPPRAPVAPRDEPAATQTAVDPRLEPNGAGWAWDCAKHGPPPPDLPAGTVLRNLRRPA